MKATFFGGGFNDRNTPEYSDTIKIGEILSNRGYEIKCGGYYGLMEAISINSKATGITCKSFGFENGNKYLDTTIVANTLYERLELLIEGSDLFIVQKGGIGTLAELFLCLDILRKRENPAKVILVGEFWKNIFLSIDLLITDKEKSLVTIINNIEELNNLI